MILLMINWKLLYFFNNIVKLSCKELIFIYFMHFAPVLLVFAKNGEIAIFVHFDGFNDYITRFIK